MAIIFHSKPTVGKEEIAACSRVIASRQLSASSEVLALEQELSGFVGHRFGVAVSSGTAALYLALRALGVIKNDQVIIPSFSCAALLNAVVFCGARAIVSDVDPFTGNLTVECIKQKLTKKTKAIIVPHMFGYPADIPSIAGLGVPIIEDCAQCIGAGIHGKLTGSLSHLSIFSFYATKLIGAGEGGMVASSDKRMVATLKDLREYDNTVTFVPRFNFKLSDVHAAIARAQLVKLPAMIEKRRLLAWQYTSALESLPEVVQVPVVEPGYNPVYFRYVVQVSSATIRDRIIKRMDAVGIQCRKPVFVPLHRYMKKPRLLWTDALYDRAISLPLYPGLGKKDIEYIVTHFMHALPKGKK